MHIVLMTGKKAKAKGFKLKKIRSEDVSDKMQAVINWSVSEGNVSLNK